MIGPGMNSGGGLLMGPTPAPPIGGNGDQPFVPTAPCAGGGDSGGNTNGSCSDSVGIRAAGGGNLDQNSQTGYQAVLFQQAGGASCQNSCNADGGAGGGNPWGGQNMGGGGEVSLFGWGGDGYSRDGQKYFFGLGLPGVPAPVACAAPVDGPTPPVPSSSSAFGFNIQVTDSISGAQLSGLLVQCVESGVSFASGCVNTFFGFASNATVHINILAGPGVSCVDGTVRNYLAPPQGTVTPGHIFPTVTVSLTRA